MRHHLYHCKAQVVSQGYLAKIGFVYNGINQFCNLVHTLLGAAIIVLASEQFT